MIFSALSLIHIFSEPYLSINEDQANVSTLYSHLSTKIAVMLNGIFHLAFPAQPSRVDKDVYKRQPLARPERWRRLWLISSRITKGI